MNTKQWTKWLSIFITILFLTACQTDTNEPGDGAQGIGDDAESSYTVTDDEGTEITFEQAPETVVSLQPSNTEILFALGVGDKVVGATDFDNYPEEALEIQRVSDSMNIDAEAIIALNPDVIIAYTIGQREMIEPLIDAGIPIFVIESATSFEDVYGDIEQIAAIMGVSEKGEQLNAEIQAQVAAVEENLQNLEDEKQIYFEISPAPEIYTTGDATFQQEIMNKASVINVFGDQEGWIKLSEEEVVSRNPEAIFTTVHYVDDPIAEIKARDGWDVISAIQNDQVFLVDGDILSRPGPRIGEAVELLAKEAYPELFE
ncbi:ABC transporter substrate-binding protein [Alkalihalobacillus sp. 1P02AB]|uniref:ABC transporter substrate-binding protein n=1 Tax=Alkalihalobacillus sp. 1P02AB TaxID=3132260 RepID=UPI0039A53B4B